MQTTPSTVKYAGLDFFLANVKAAAERASVPVAMHLDHGSSFELAMQAYRTGYTSIMIDGSHGSFEENVAVSKAVADACAPSGIPVEAELGKVGGKEDDLDGGDDNPIYRSSTGCRICKTNRSYILSCGNRNSARCIQRRTKT